MTSPGLAAIAFLVLLGGVAFTLVSGVVQLRGLVDGLRARGPDRALRRAGAVGSIGMGSIAGAALAIAVGGAPALPWMVLGSFLGMAITHAEVLLAVRFKGARQDGTRSAGPVDWTRGAAIPGARGLALAYALVFPFAALALGGLFQGQQAAALAAATWPVDPRFVGGVLGAAALALAFVPRARPALAVAGVLAVAGYAIAALLVVASDLEALAPAIDAILGRAEEGSVLGGAAGASVFVALQHGLLRATFATESGLGTAALREEVLACEDPRTAARAAMVVPLLGGGVLAVLTGLAVLVSGAAPRRAIAEVDDDGRAHLAALEQPHVRGLIPSLERGQVIVLPEDTPLEPMKRYSLVMRANPRGSELGKLSPEDNAIAVPVWGVTQDVTTIVFRSADPERRLNPAYDRRVEVVQERTVLANGMEALVLRPADETIQLAELKRRMRGPYVQLGDYYFDGGVARASHPRYGEHLALFEDPGPDAPANPPLRSVVTFGFRGPYFYDREDRGRAPSALVGVEGFSAAVGEVLTMRMEADPRGVALGSVVPGTDAYETPGWNFLRGTTRAILRHDSDPSQDLVIPVEHSVHESGTLRFVSAVPDVVDFRRAHEMKEFSGPYLLPPPFEFRVEAHGGARLPAEWRERVALVPIHPLPEPQGGPGEPYDPHPGEVFQSDMRGPWLAREGSVLLADAFSNGLGRTGGPVLAIFASFLALTTALAWGSGGARVCSYLLGPPASGAFKLALAVAVFAGAASDLPTVLAVCEPLLLATLAVHLLALGLALPKITGRS